MALLAVPLAGAAPAFKTPSGAAYCGVVEAFEVPRDYIPSLICWTPNDGFTVTMNVVGIVTKRYERENRGAHSVARVLSYGKVWRRRASAFIGVERRGDSPRWCAQQPPLLRNAGGGKGRRLPRSVF